MSRPKHLPSLTRRSWLRAAGAAGVACALPALAPLPARAQGNLASLGPEETVDATMKRLFAGRPIKDGAAQIKIDMPLIAENGAVVPIGVSSSLADVTSIAILVTENPFTLAAAYKIPAGTVASVSNRLKMAKTTNVIAVVEAGGKLYSASKEVKVTVGGCGG